MTDIAVPLTASDSDGLGSACFPSATLPLSGWRVNWSERRDGQAVLEIADSDGELVGLAGSTMRALLSVDAAWRGTGADVEGVRRWWALAIGHVGPSSAPPVVTFTRRVAAHGHVHRAVVEPTTWRGLWLAAALGTYTSVSCSHDGAHRIRRLAPAPTFSPA